MVERRFGNESLKSILVAYLESQIDIFLKSVDNENNANASHDESEVA